MPSRLLPSSHLLRVHVLSPPPPPSSKHPLRKAIIIPIISSALAFSAVATLFFFIYWYRKLLKHRSNNKTSPEDGSGSFKVCRFKYRQLKRATKCFSQSEKLGKGGFGVVYRGLLPNSKEVAVKRLDLSSLQGEREFQNELSICSKLDSPYVVRLLGYCTHGRRVRLLVYECMQNRSLQEALFEKGYHTPLDWDKRFKIIVDIAKALEFLHLKCNPSIIHGDVKPSNILLDSDFSARIADFGLARFKTEDLGSNSVSRLRSDTSGGFRFGTASSFDPETPTPELSRRNLFSDYSYRTAAESPSVNHNLLANEASVAMNSSAGELADMDLTSALSTPSFHNEAGAEADLRQRVHSTVAVDVLTDIRTHGSLGLDKPVPLELDLASLPLSRQIFPEKAPENDLWWRQEISGELAGKKYVMDWLGSEHCRSSNKLPENEIVLDFEEDLEAKEQKLKARLNEPSLENSRKERRAKLPHRKSREWWKDEYFAELNNKNKVHQNVRRKREKVRSVDNWKDFLSGELGSLSVELRRTDHKVAKELGLCWSKKWFHSTRSGDLSWCRGKDRRSMADDIWSADLNYESMIHQQWSGDLSRSGELISRDLSSTTSMRGTVCYVAPEYGGNGELSEKSDIYSFGVLLLVILSGRRPIQVTASPLKEFERANLISWARYLSQSGRLLDLMDEGLRGEYNHKQAKMCITVALLCLQRVPTTRPDISEVLKILLGESKAPCLPFELSPSPPSRMHYRLPLRLSKNLPSVAATP